MDKFEVFFYGVVFLVICLISLVGVGIAAFFEAKTFNECTGGNATTWVASHSDLLGNDWFIVE